MIESLINASNLEKGLFVTIAGMLGVFFVLVVFFLLIKGLEILFPYKDGTEEEA